YLQEKGVSASAPRKEWPAEVLRRVFLELSEDTPSQLFSQELWCSSCNATEWLRKRDAFTTSTAVMSMIGYVFGLGDRHLGNILTHLGTGEILHIDYNICFDR